MPKCYWCREQQRLLVCKDCKGRTHKDKRSWARQNEIHERVRNVDGYQRANNINV